MEIKKELLEGAEELAPGANPSISGTSTEPNSNLSNVPTPTPEQEEDAGIVDDLEAKQEIIQEGSEPSQEPGLVPEEVSAPGAGPSTEPVTNPETGTNDPVPPEEAEMSEEDGVFSSSATQMFTQSQVDEITGKTRKETRERTLRSVFSRYGVTSEDELDDLFGNAQRYETLREEYDTEKAAHAERENMLNELSEQVALLKSGIDEKRYDDARFILRGKGMDVTLENIEAELATHPEWKKQEAEAEMPMPSSVNPHFTKRPDLAPEEAELARPAPSRLSVLGNSSADTPAPRESERDIALKKIFKV